MRLEFANPKGHLQAGQLVTARIVADAERETAEVLAVPRSAVEQVEGKTVVFVQTGDGFERRNVLTGAPGGDADRDPRRGWRPASGWRSKGPSSSRASCSDEPGGIVEVSVRRRGVVLAIWAAIFAAALASIRSACRSTPSPT